MQTFHERDDVTFQGLPFQTVVPLPLPSDRKFPLHGPVKISIHVSLINWVKKSSSNATSVAKLLMWLLFNSFACFFQS